MKTWEEHDSNDLSSQECKLLSGAFATFLQVVLGLIALFVLFLKRYYEVPQRPLQIWAFDASKQMIGAGFAHAANLLIAIMLYEHGKSKTNKHDVDQCAFYFVNFTMDTSFGVLLNWLLLSAFSQIAIYFQWTSLMIPGDYGTPPRISTWMKQLATWVVIIFLAKILIACVIVLLEKPLAEFAIWLFTPLQPYPRVELSLVMIACPCLMNMLQFWIQDSFLKKDIRTTSTLAAKESPEHRKKVMEKTLEKKTPLPTTNSNSPTSSSFSSSSSCTSSNSSDQSSSPISFGFSSRDKIKTKKNPSKIEMDEIAL